MFDSRSSVAAKHSLAVITAKGLTNNRVIKRCGKAHAPYRNLEYAMQRVNYVRTRIAMTAVLVGGLLAAGSVSSVAIADQRGAAPTAAGPAADAPSVPDPGVPGPYRSVT